MDFKNLTPPQQLCSIMSRIYEAKLTTPSGGNLSLKDEQGNIWVTPSGGDKGRYMEGDILKILPDGMIQGNGRPSVETEIHRAILRCRPKSKGVVHAHPPNLVAVSLLRQTPETKILPGVFNKIRSMRVALYGCPGSELLKENVEREFLEDRHTNAVILENHGAFVVAEGGIKEAFGLFQDLDHSVKLQARASFYAQGKVKTISDSQMETYNRIEAEEAKQLETFEDTAMTEEERTREKHIRKEICIFMDRGYRRGLFTQNIGVISARLDKNSFLITERDADNAELTDMEVVKIVDGRTESGKTPSRSFLLHKKIYEENPEINAVIMAAPANAMVFAVTDYNYDLKTIPECYIVLREEISKFPFGSVMGQREALARYFGEKAPVAIVENDCYICTGESIFNAFDKMEVLEFSAEAVINAKLLGGQIKMISEAQAQEIKDTFK